MKKKQVHQHKTKMKESFGDRMVGVVCYIIFSLCALVCVYPFYYIFINTISANDLSARGVILFWPRGIHFQNYVSALKIDGLFQAAKISLGRTVIGTFCTVGASAFLGYMFTQEDMWHKKFWYRLLVATMYFNAGIIPWFLTMKNMHLTNNFLGYILPAIVSPFNIILTKTFVESVPKELQEAAEIDGANRWQQIVNITIPSLVPMITVMLLLSVGNIMRSDTGLFYQVTRNSGQLYSTTQVIDSYVLNAIFKNSNFGFVAATTFFQSVVGLLMMLLANGAVRKIAPENALF